VLHATKSRHSGEKSDLWKRYALIVSLIVIVFDAHAQSNVSGTWTLAHSPYRINGEITIPDDSTYVDSHFEIDQLTSVVVRCLFVGLTLKKCAGLVSPSKTSWLFPFLC